MTTLALMGLLLATSALLTLGAWGADRLLRPLRLPTRALWLVALLLPLGIAATSPWRGRNAAPDAPRFARLGAIVTTPLAGGLAAIAATRTPRARLFDGALLAAWCLTSGILLAGVAHAVQRLGRATRRTRRGLVDGVRVRLSDALGPVVVGLRTPEMILPRWVLTRDGAERRLILAHESEHVRARDPLWLCAGAVAAALMPWNPLAWWSLARLRLAIELDCDARVLRAGAPADRYGELLISLSATAPRERLGLAAFAARPSHLEARILAMTMHQPSPRRRVLSMGAATAVGAAALLAACGSDVGDHTPVSTEVVAAGRKGAPPAGAAADAAEAASGTPFFDFQVEQPAAPASGGGFPRYPADLRSAGVEGEVLAQFVVGTDGRVEAETFRSLRASDPRFEQAIRDALPAMRFTPARVGGQAVRQLVQQPFVFQLSR